MRFVDKSRTRRINLTDSRDGRGGSLSLEVESGNGEPRARLMLANNDCLDGVLGELELDATDMDSIARLLEGACKFSYRDVVSGRIHFAHGAFEFTLHNDTLGEPFAHGVSFEFADLSTRAGRFAHVFVEDHDGRKLAQLIRSALDPDVASAA